MTNSMTLAAALPASSHAVDETSAHDSRGSTVPASSHRVNPASPDVVALNFRVPREFRRQLKVLAAERGISMTALLERALECLVNCETHNGTRDHGAGRCD